MEPDCKVKLLFGIILSLLCFAVSAYLAVAKGDITYFATFVTAAIAIIYAMFGINPDEMKK